MLSQGLGKTVEILALIAGDTDVTGTTLVVCPASVILQWKQEIMSKLPDARVVVFHGASRDTVSFSDLGSRTVVITTYDFSSRLYGIPVLEDAREGCETDRSLTVVFLPSSARVSGMIRWREHTQSRARATAHRLRSNGTVLFSTKGT